MLAVASVLAALIAGGVFMHLACALATWAFFRKRPRKAEECRPVTIMIPIKGADPDAYRSWLSACTQDYPEYEVVMGTMDRDDPAVPVIERVVADSHGRGRYVHCGEVLGINHQISNVIQLLRAARYDTVILMDSDIKVTPDYLSTVVAPLEDPAMGVVTCGYVDKDPEAAPGALASLGRCVDFIPSVLLARFIDKGMHFAIGPTIATRKDVIEAFGGLEQVVNRIGSDFHIGRMASEAGYQVELSRYVLDNPERKVDLRTVFLREARWARTIRINRGPQYFGIIVGHAVLFSPLLVLLAGAAPWSLAVAGAGILARALQVAVSLTYIGTPQLARWAWLMPAREALSLGVWGSGASGNSIYWRGRRLKIQPGGILEEAGS